MVSYQGIFKRYEKKYLLSPAVYEDFLKKAGDRLIPDRFGQSTVRSLYYDTADYRLIRSSLEKPLYKEKLRLRSYGIPGYTDPVFLELKKKYKGVVYKRRVSLPLEEARRALEPGGEEWLVSSHSVLPEPGEAQIRREIAWFLSRETLYPQVLISCDRTAYIEEHNPDLRITFDRDIRWRANRLDLAQGGGSLPLMDTERILMEIKIPGAFPLWLCHILDKLALYPVSFSKYGLCYRQYLRNLPDRRVNPCLTAS